METEELIDIGRNQYLVRTGYGKNVIIYSTQTGTHVGMICLDGEPGAADMIYSVTPSFRVHLKSLNFSSFGGAEAFIKAIAVEAAHIDSVHDGHSPVIN